MFKGLFNRKSKIVTSDTIGSATYRNNFTGNSRPISVRLHFFAVSQKRIDRKKGRESTLWDIKVTGEGQGRRTTEDYELNLTYKDMCKEMLVLEKQAAGRENCDTEKFIKERLPFVKKNNILHFVKP